MSYLLRRATLNDSFCLTELSASTFYATYAHLNPPGIVEEYIAIHLNETAIQKELTTVGNTFYILYESRKAIGYIQLRESDEVAKELPDTRNLELFRIYINEAFKGKGLGKVLIDKALSHAKENNFEVLWLGVWSENHRAMGFYQHQGFEVFGEHTFLMVDDPQKDWLLCKKI